MEPDLARRLWLVGEPLHAVTYFAPESLASWEAVGLRGFWRGYFATRAAPFGATGPEVVVATFFNFAPAVVERALPAVWDMASPAAALAARQSGAAASLRAVLGPALDGDAVAGAVGAIRRALAGCSPAGRALFAANAGLPWPDDPVAALWHGLTLLREHRGDGHNAALVAADVDGCEAHVLAGAVGAGGTGAEARRVARGWTDAEWGAATDGLRDRGLVDGAGEPTAEGRRLHADVEARTDAAALEPWRRLGAEAADELVRTLRPWAVAVSRSGAIRFPNPMGLPPPDDE